MNHPRSFEKTQKKRSNWQTKRNRGGPSNLTCDINPKATLTQKCRDSHRHLPQTLKNSKGGLWGVKDGPRCPGPGGGGPCVLSGISVVLQQVKRAHTNTHGWTQYTHANAIVFQLNGSMLIAFHAEQQPGSFVCTHTHTQIHTL